MFANRARKRRSVIYVTEPTSKPEYSVGNPSLAPAASVVGDLGPDRAIALSGPFISKSIGVEATFAGNRRSAVGSGRPVRFCILQNPKMGVAGSRAPALWHYQPSQGLEADMSQDVDINRLFDLADQKQYAVSRTSLSADVRLIDIEGKLATPKSGSPTRL